MDSKSLFELALLAGNKEVCEFISNHTHKAIDSISINPKNIYTKEFKNSAVEEEVEALFNKASNMSNFVQMSSLKDEVIYRLSKEIHIYNIYTDKLIGVVLPWIGGLAERDAIKDKFNSLETL